MPTYTLCPFSPGDSKAIVIGLLLWADPSDPTPANPRQPEKRMYPVLAISQGQVSTGILPGCGDDCYPPCLQTRVSYSKIIGGVLLPKESLGMSWLRPFFSVLHSLVSILENPKGPRTLLLAQDSLDALALPGTGMKTNTANAIHAWHPAPHTVPQHSLCPACPRQVLRSSAEPSPKRGPRQEKSEEQPQEKLAPKDEGVLGFNRLSPHNKDIPRDE